LSPDPRATSRPLEVQGKGIQYFAPSRTVLCPRKTAPSRGKSKRKVVFLLKRILKQATDGSLDETGQAVTTTDAIKAALTKALDKQNGITRVVFEAEEQSGAPAHFIYPKNSEPGVQIGKTLNIILVCPAPLNDGEQDTLPQDPDQGEEDLPDVSSTAAKPPKRKKTGKKATSKKTVGRKAISKKAKTKKKR